MKNEMNDVSNVNDVNDVSNVNDVNNAIANMFKNNIDDLIEAMSEYFKELVKEVSEYSNDVSEDTNEDTNGDANEDISETNTEDVVNNPKHYKLYQHECIEEMILVFGIEDVKAFCKCNIWKYRYRASAKNGEEDLRKAEWYMNKLEELNKL